MSFGKGDSELSHEKTAQSGKSITDEVIELFRVDIFFISHVRFEFYFAFRW